MKVTPGEVAIMDKGAYPLLYGAKGERICKMIDEPKSANIKLIEKMWNV